MSDTSQGDGWWLASDGKWYPPTSTPAPEMPPPPVAPLAPPAYGQAPAYAQTPGYMPAQVAPSSNEAIWSLVLGILSITCLGLIAGIPAVILGSIAKRKIAESGGVIRGQGLATAGLVLGWVSIGFSVLAILFIILGAIAGSGSSGALGL
ncbi:unannotated protein [freshwater metagenome]|uniref:Unannotated protein n=1 Tax=freshwater metagenome TaxID=449393 RepID=A0A6J5YET3_9ZZZZ